MSRDFSGALVIPYIGPISSVPIKLGNISSVCVPLFFNWNVYNASSIRSNIAVTVDLDGKGVTSLDQVRSVYIDNTGSSVPIYVLFPDTGYVVVAKPESEGWYPAFTNTKKLRVIGQGFFTGSIPQTVILLSNVPLIPNVNTELDNSIALWLASSTISRGATIYNTNFGTPALGDQFTTAILNVNTNDQHINLFLTPQPSGFIYVTDIFVELQTYSGGAAIASNNVFFESLGIAGQFFSTGFTVAANQTINQLILLEISGNFKLDATQQWRVRNQVVQGNPSGACVFNFAYTSNPN